MFSPEAVETVRSRLDIVEVVGRVVTLRRQGRDLVGLCPFHQEKTPSFRVSPDKQVYYCFGCQAGGDVFDFVMRREGLTFGEALLELARQAGVSVEETVSPEERKRHARQERLFEAMALAQRFYRKLLLDHPAGEPARRYLEARGVSAASIERFELGYAPPAWDALVRALLRRGVREEDLAAAGLASPRRRGEGLYDRFRSRLMFPIRDERGRLRGFGGRIIGEGEPKYLNSPETPIFRKGEIWYGLPLARDAIRRRNQVVIAEGYMDVLTAHQYGIEETVAALGTAMTEEQGRTLMRHSDRIILAYDADRAGAGAAGRSLQIFQGLGARVAVARIPEGKDPDDFLRERGADAFRRLLDEALPLVEYRLQVLIEEHGVQTAEGKAAIVRALLPDLQALASEVARQDYLRRMAETLSVSEASIRAEWKKWNLSRGSLQRKSYNSVNHRDTRNDLPLDKDTWSSTGARRKAEEDLLARMLSEPELRMRIGARLTPEDFSEGVARRLAEVIFSAPPEDGPAELLGRQEDPDLRRWLAALSIQEKESDGAERIVRDELLILEEERRLRRVADLEHEIRRREAAGEPIPSELLHRLNRLLMSRGRGEDDESREG